MKLLRGAGLDVEFLGERVRTHKLDGECREYDLVAAGKAVVVVVEMQPTLCEADVKSFVSRLGDCREWRPDHARPRMFGALGYVTGRGGATGAAEAPSFYLIRAVGSTASIVTSEGFEPRLY